MEIVIAAVAVLSIFFAFLKGKQAEKDKLNREKLRTYEKAKSIEERINGLNDADMSKLLREKFTRK